jgi:hypothetical protein
MKLKKVMSEQRGNCTRDDVDNPVIHRINVAPKLLPSWGVFPLKGKK